MRYPYKCPVCEGQTVTEYWSGPAKCRSCEGTGIVWSPEDDTVPVFSVPIPLEMPDKFAERFVSELAMFCEHANEVPMNCFCNKFCYCKSHTCKGT